MPKLELQNLNKTYTPKIIPVKDITLTVDDREFLTLLGPSGCGKSTALRLIAGLETPTHGRILIGDKDVTHQSPGDRNIAMVFQSYALYPHMTVYENLCSGLKLKKLPLTEINQRVAEVSQVLGLEDLMHRKPAQLSGGQRQRIAVGRALVRRPDVFLLDEPLSNLDALLRERVRADLKQLFTTQSVPVVYVTHDQTEAMTLSTKVAVLNDGYVQQLDNPEQIYNRPANLFVAGFVGSPQMNLLTLACEGQNAILGNTRIPRPSSFPIPSQIVLGIRPEHIQIAKPEDPTSIGGRVTLVENLGMHYLVSVDIHNSRSRSVGHPESPIDQILRVLIPSDRNWNSEEIALTLPPKHIHWFDIETGNSLLSR
jgi:multiple sugar transport system ATP-binding protein